MQLQRAFLSRQALARIERFCVEQGVVLMYSQLERMYEYGGKILHLVELHGTNSAICGYNPYLGNWYGVSVDYKGKSLCKDCEKLNDGNFDSP